MVEKGGKLLYSYFQENPADHASNEDILKVIFSLLLFRGSHHDVSDAIL